MERKIRLLAEKSQLVLETDSDPETTDGRELIIIDFLDNKELSTKKSLSLMLKLNKIFI